jgi:hypothetical protein
VLVALYTSPHLNGIALRTVSDEDSEIAMAAALPKRISPLVARIDSGGCAVYLRRIVYTHDEGLRVANAILHDTRSSVYLRLWAKCWLTTHGHETDGCATLVLSYAGQVHTLGKTCAKRWGREDSGYDGTGLLNQMRQKLQTAHGQDIEYVSSVVLDHGDIAEIARAGCTDLLSATDFCEKVVCGEVMGHYKEGGANCIMPGCGQKWGWMVSRLRDCVKRVSYSLEKGGDSTWWESEEGIEAKASTWNLPASEVCVDDSRLCDFIAHKYEQEEPPTARELEHELCSYAGAYT